MDFVVDHPQLEEFPVSIGRRRFNLHKNNNSIDFTLADSLKARRSFCTRESRPMKIQVKRKNRISPEETLFKLEQKIASKQEELSGLQRMKNLDCWDRLSPAGTPIPAVATPIDRNLVRQRKLLPKVYMQPYFTKLNPKVGYGNPITGSFEMRDMYSLGSQRRGYMESTPQNRRLSDYGMMRANSPANLSSIIY